MDENEYNISECVFEWKRDKIQFVVIIFQKEFLLSVSDTHISCIVLLIMMEMKT